MKLYYIKLTYGKSVVNVGCERFRGITKRLLARLMRDLCYSPGTLKGEIQSRKVSLKEWLGAI